MDGAPAGKDTVLTIVHLYWKFDLKDLVAGFNLIGEPKRDIHIQVGQGTIYHTVDTLGK